MAIKDYSTNADLNTTISGINIAEGCAPSGINNAIRQLMADVKTEKEAKDAEQATKDGAQDAAISAAQTAANSRISNATIDGLDLVLTYGDGSTKRVQLPAGKSVGDLWMGFDSKSKPANVQLYAGQLLSRASYEAHSAFVLGGNRTVLSESEWQARVSADGFCPLYSSGDGSTTYRMPLIKGVHPEFVAALAEAGQYKKAGGSFDASKSNPIYGNSDTVQPPSVTCVLGEYVVGSVAVIGEADAESLLAGQTLLDGKVGALENGVGRAGAYITETWSSGTSWYRKYSDGWIEQGGQAQTVTTANTTTITLYKQMASSAYTVYSSKDDASAALDVKSMPSGRAISSVTFTTFSTYNNSVTTGSITFDWLVMGQGA